MVEPTVVRPMQWANGQGALSPKAFAVLMKPLIDVFEPKAWDAKVPVYFEALRDIPEKLLDTAVRHCIRSCEFFPKPAEIRGAISDELEALRQRRNEEMIRARALPEPERVPPSPEDIAYVENLLRPMRQKMAERTAVLKEEDPT